MFFPGTFVFHCFKVIHYQLWLQVPCLVACSWWVITRKGLSFSPTSKLSPWTEFIVFNLIWPQTLLLHFFLLFNHLKLHNVCTSVRSSKVLLELDDISCICCSHCHCNISSCLIKDLLHWKPYYVVISWSSTFCRENANKLVWIIIWYLARYYRRSLIRVHFEGM